MPALTWELSLAQTLAVMGRYERPPESRFRIGSPCRWIRAIDVLVHIVIPELLEQWWPAITRALRDTSPRWGRSWRH